MGCSGLWDAHSAGGVDGLGVDHKPQSTAAQMASHVAHATLLLQDTGMCAAPPDSQAGHSLEGPHSGFAPLRLYQRGTAMRCAAQHLLGRFSQAACVMRYEHLYLIDSAGHGMSTYLVEARLERTRPGPDLRSSSCCHRASPT